MQQIADGADDIAWHLIKSASRNVASHFPETAFDFPNDSRRTTALGWGLRTRGKAGRGGRILDLRTAGARRIAHRHPPRRIQIGTTTTAIAITFTHETDPFRLKFSRGISLQASASLIPS